MEERLRLTIGTCKIRGMEFNEGWAPINNFCIERLFKQAKPSLKLEDAENKLPRDEEKCTIFVSDETILCISNRPNCQWII